MKLYHYSSVKIKSIDMSKCDGFWMTTIAPTQTDLLDEIGAAGSKFCMVVEFNDSGEELTNVSNDDVENQLINNDCDFIRNIYDRFSDYATCNADLVTILEIMEMQGIGMTDRKKKYEGKRKKVNISFNLENQEDQKRLEFIKDIDFSNFVKLKIDEAMDEKS